MRLLIADKYPQSHLELLAAGGHECDFQPSLTADDLGAALAGIEGLVVRSTGVTDQALEEADSLRLIIRAGSGTNTIAVKAAIDRGIQVSNVPGRNAVAVAELAMGLIIAIDRNIPDNVAELRAGNWDKARFSAAQGILGRKLGIVGMGNIGLALAYRAVAFGMDVFGVVKERSAAASSLIADAGIVLVADLEALLATCDVVSIHTPYAGDVVVDAEFLGHMRPGSILINTARGELVDEDALIAAMEAKDIRAGLDIFRDEPAAPSGPFHSKLASHPNVYGTHHIGASTAQAQTAVADEVIAIIEAFGRGEARNVVEVK
ncbi:MAG: NAD(P)-binding domain-containing protein [Acidimicrobiia bacterium]|nr:NAD(P)-binding domain-containing protein [Acidimicrobiia bacterium]